MQKKHTLPISLLLSGLILMSGCGKTEEPNAASVPAAPAVSTDSDKGSTNDAADVTDNAETEENEEITVSFGLNETIKHEGLCEMSDLYAEVLDDAAIAEGWFYYYTDSDKSPADIIIWKPSDGNHTTLEVLFTVKNISEMPCSFGDKITAQMSYCENDAPQTICYSGTVFQQNPGQVEASGEMIMWSTSPVDIAPGESANVSFRFDIPKDVYEQIYATATGGDAGISETCEFSFGDGTTYIVDLAQVLIPASQS